MVFLNIEYDFDLKSNCLAFINVSRAFCYNLLTPKSPEGDLVKSIFASIPFKQRRFFTTIKGGKLNLAKTKILKPWFVPPRNINKSTGFR